MNDSLKRLGRVAIAGAIIGAVLNVTGYAANDKVIGLIFQVAGTAALSAVGKFLRSKFGDSIFMSNLPF